MDVCSQVGKMLNKTERTLLYASNLWYLSEGMLGPLFGVYCSRFGATPLDISTVWAVYLISVGTVIIVLGYLSDFVEKEKLLFTGYLLQTILTFSYIFVSTKQQLLFLQIGLGISGGLSSTTWYVLYARSNNKEKEGFIWGIAGGLGSIYGGIALLCGGYIIVKTSFETLFFVMGLVQLMATIFVSKLLRKSYQTCIRQIANDEDIINHANIANQ